MNIHPAIVNNQQDVNHSPNYYSVEFALNESQPVYQFKLWRSDRNTLFFLVKKNSALLSQLKVGRVMPMKYYIDEEKHPTKVHKTQIYKIINETQGRFKGHCRIQLEFVQKAKPRLLQ